MDIVEAARRIQIASSYLEEKLAERVDIEKELAEHDLRMHKGRGPILNKLRINTQVVLMARENIVKTSNTVRDLLGDDRATI